MKDSLRVQGSDSSSLSPDLPVLIGVLVPQPDPFSNSKNRVPLVTDIAKMEVKISRESARLRATTGADMILKLVSSLCCDVEHGRGTRSLYRVNLFSMIGQDRKRAAYLSFNLYLQ